MVFALLAHFALLADPLTVLLDETLPASYAGPGALDASMKDWLSPAQRKLVHARKADILKRVRGKDDAVSVLLLGELGAVDEVPRLKRLFVEAHDTYGWETSRPCSLDAGQHPLRHAIEESLRALTGKNVEQLITLSDADIERLRDDEDDGAYVLSRLRPDVLAADLMRKFHLEMDRTERFLLALQLEHVLVGRDVAILGLRKPATTTTFRVVSLHELPEIFEVVSDGRVIVSAALREVQ